MRFFLSLQQVLHTLNRPSQRKRTVRRANRRPCPRQSRPAPWSVSSALRKKTCPHGIGWCVSSIAPLTRPHWAFSVSYLVSPHLCDFYNIHNSKSWFRCWCVLYFLRYADGSGHHPGARPEPSGLQVFRRGAGVPLPSLQLPQAPSHGLDVLCVFCYAPWWVFQKTLDEMHQWLPTFLAALLLELFSPFIFIIGFSKNSFESFWLWTKPTCSEMYHFKTITQYIIIDLY